MFPYRRTTATLFLALSAHATLAQQHYLDMRAAVVDDLGEVVEQSVFVQPITEESLYVSATRTSPEGSVFIESLAEASLITGQLHLRTNCRPYFDQNCSGDTSWKDQLLFDATGIPAGETVTVAIDAATIGQFGPTLGTGYTLYVQSVANFTVVDTLAAYVGYWHPEITTTANSDAFQSFDQSGTWLTYGPDRFVGQLELQGGAVNTVHVETIVIGDTEMDITATFRIDSDPALGFVSDSGVFLSVDTDADGLADRIDNCTLHANPDQVDVDTDGFGNRCDPDFDQSGNVNFADLAYISSVFLSDDALADLNGDGSVNFGDLAIVKAFFLGSPGPAGTL